MHTTSNESDLDRTARRRAAAKMGWFIHAAVFVAVNLLIAATAFAAGQTWAIYPASGWALGLAIHGLVVFLVTGSGGLHQRLVQRERERLSVNRDAW